MTLARSPSRELSLNCLPVNPDAGRAAINDHPDPRAMRFSKGCNAKQNAGLG